MTERRVVVLVSGGLDSTVCSAIAAAENDHLIAVVFDYGQRHRRELESAAEVAAYFGAELLTVTLNARDWGGSALTDDLVEVPVSREIDESIPATYVPARNLVFLSIALGIAEAREADQVFIGVNALDYSGYPDCRPEFIESFGETGALALKRGVEGNPVRVVAPLIKMTKSEIVALGCELDAPLDLTWSCYLGGNDPCGVCDSCVLRARGFAEAGVDDPALSGSR